MIYRLNQDLSITEYEDRWIEYPLCKYIPDNSLVIPNGVIDPNNAYYGVPDGSLLDQINNFKNISYVIFDDSGNPINSDDRINKISYAGIQHPVIILNSLFKYFNNPHQDQRIKFFPFWAVWSSDPYNINYRILVHQDFSSHPKRYKLSCLNGTPWNHRLLNYLYLSKKPYFKDILFSFGHRGQPADLMNDLILTQDELNDIALLPKNVTAIDQDAVSGIDVTCSHPAYLYTYFNLVTETNIRTSTPMLSEKSFKPIIVGQLFVLIAAPGAVQFLRDIGVDTFDDIIDHGYDNELDHRIRIQKALAQVDQLMSKDLEKIYKTIYSRLKHNSEYLRSQEFRNQFLVKFD